LNDLSQVKDIVVLEDQGLVVFVTGTAIWQATIPLVQ